MFKRLMRMIFIRNSPSKAAIHALSHFPIGYAQGYFNAAKQAREDAEVFYSAHPLTRPFILYEHLDTPLSITEDEYHWMSDLNQQVVDDQQDVLVSPWIYFSWDDLTTTFGITESYPKLHIDA